MPVPEQIERLCTSISQCLATVPSLPPGLREAAGNFLRSLLRNYPCGEARAGAVPEAVEHLCTLLSQCPATVPDMPPGLRKAADNLRRALLRNYPATQAAPSDAAPGIAPLPDGPLPANAQAKIDGDIAERLKQLLYAAAEGRDTLRMEEELRVLAGGGSDLENRIAEAIRKGEKAREERSRLKKLLNQGLLSGCGRILGRAAPARRLVHQQGIQRDPLARRKGTPEPSEKTGPGRRRAMACQSKGALRPQAE